MIERRPSTPKKTTCRRLFAGALLGIGMLGAVATPSTSFAQLIDPDLYDGGKARVNLSDNLRSLTEAIASASCRFHGQIDAEAARYELAVTMNDFNVIITALEHGNPALGIPTPETRALTVDALFNTVIAWAPIAASANRLANGNGTDDDAAVISDSYAGLFDQSVLLASVISGQYSNPQELLQSDATVLNFALRQRALAYRMSRAMCEMTTQTGDERTLDELAETVDLFERTLVALRDGFPDAGIHAPPNEAVKDSLERTYTQWQEGRTLFDAALAGETPSPDDVINAAALADQLSVAMNNTITLYLIASPGREGVYRVPLEAFARTALTEWTADPALIEAVKAQNARHADLTQAEITALDAAWQSGDPETQTPDTQALLSHPLSVWLNDQQMMTAGFVTEVLVMDNKGLNVAQSVETADYWQGDEPIWRETFLAGPGALHISEIEFHESTGFYQSQAALAIEDPQTGEVIGAIAFGINVQNLM
ncbi:type IV pili methyl-accepting chemotaxis transducer N-terminal domain-containing protein [Yoonia sp. BS5-3]|uniref:Type IV pili methyl-accepting chemotaxis transducer N-terminal domain-containing protein n=1 Tax=Yoonia phaeophyticola TaxID=3137369 RepID=A0ABZ2V588_9RHOB